MRRDSTITFDEQNRLIHTTGFSLSLSLSTLTLMHTHMISLTTLLILRWFSLFLVRHGPILSLLDDTIFYPIIEFVPA